MKSFGVHVTMATMCLVCFYTTTVAYPKPSWLPVQGQGDRMWPNSVIEADDNAFETNHWTDYKQQDPKYTNQQRTQYLKSSLDSLQDFLAQYQSRNAEAQVGPITDFLVGSAERNGEFGDVPINSVDHIQDRIIASDLKEALNQIAKKELGIDDQQLDSNDYFQDMRKEKRKRSSKLSLQLSMSVLRDMLRANMQIKQNQSLNKLANIGK